MSLLAWICVTILAGCILGGILCVWVSDDDPAAHAERDASEAPPRRLTFGKPESLVCEDPGVTAETWTVQQWTTPELNAAAKRLAEHQVTERVQEGRP